MCTTFRRINIECLGKVCLDRDSGSEDNHLPVLSLGSEIADSDSVLNSTYQSAPRLNC